MDRPAQRPAPARDAERRQLTVMFCDLVGSTALSARLDPEDLREVVRAYQETCAKVIGRYEGYLAKYLGDGLLVHFGYPVAHEDDAERAVRAGLGIVEEMERLSAGLEGERDVRLALRVGIHTGLVVAGEMGTGDQREALAIVGETPNVAARLQDLAEPGAVVISAATLRLIQGLFVCQELGARTLKGLSEPVVAYRVIQPSGVRGRLDVQTAAGLTPLVGRTQEVGVLLECWEQVRDGQGQVALLTGEAGVGKSRLVYVLRERLANEPHTWLECRCSPYTQNSALYPVIDLVQQGVQFGDDDCAEEKVGKLERALGRAGLSVSEVLPLFAALLSVPLPTRHPPLRLSPDRQRQKTLDALLEWLFALAAQQPMLLVVEDLHWVDPSTLELLSLLIAREPTARLFVLLTYRPEFRPPWPMHAHLTQLTISRLARRQVAVMAEHVAGNKGLPADLVQEIVAKTDGVPLFVEELTKMILESDAVRETDGRYELTGALPTLGVPATLHDSLIARLDRHGAAKAKEVAQLAAVLGREFSYDLLRAVARVDATALEQALARLVAAELVYQRGVPPQAVYSFKHALIQEAAYQSLLKSRRHELHARVAHVLEERFPERVAAEPEVIARHCEEAGLAEEAIAYYERAGQRATEGSANGEAIEHFSKGIELLLTLPEGTERDRHELRLQIALGAPLQLARGYGTPEVERTYERALALCRQLGDAPELFQALSGLQIFYRNQGPVARAIELGVELLDLAKGTGKSTHLLLAHSALANPLLPHGELSRALEHFEQALALYDPIEHRSLVSAYGMDPGISSLGMGSWALWQLGYPERALQRSEQAIELAREGTYPITLVLALVWDAAGHQKRGEPQRVLERAEEAIAISTQQGFPTYVSFGLLMRAWALSRVADAEEAHRAFGEMQKSMAQAQRSGSVLIMPSVLGLAAETICRVGGMEEALGSVNAGLSLSAERHVPFWDAELHRLKGEIRLAQDPAAHEEAGSLFLRAIEIARSQEGKSLQLRAAISLARLRQKLGKKDDARDLLAPIYDWFTEGFDTQDLKDARALLDELR